MSMTVANYAGLSRIILTPIAVFFVLWNGQQNSDLAAGVVVLAIVSDFLDGYLARRYGTVSNFGIYLDLISDKIFICSLLIALTINQMISVWITVIIIFREFFVMGIRAYAASEGIVMAAQLWGKLKTICLFPAIFGILLGIKFSYWLMLLAVILAIFSSIDYMVKARAYLSE